MSIQEQGEERIDTAALAKAARQSLNARQFRERFERFSAYAPSKMQLAYHSCKAVERMFLAGSQMGKTYAVGFEVAAHALLRYPGVSPAFPEGWQGHRMTPDPNTPQVFWCISPTAQMSRDGCLKRLAGDTLTKGELGTGFLPLESIVEVIKARGIAGFIDTVVVRRDDGGVTFIRFKTHEQGREALQSESCALCWFDEAMRDFDLYTEGLARTTAVPNSLVCVSETPLRGRDLLIQHFEKETPNRQTIKMTIHDVPDSQISPERKAYLLNEQYSNAAERACRLFAVPMLGQGAIWTQPWEQVTHTLTLADIGPGWLALGGMDFASGTSDTAHPAAFVTMVQNPDDGMTYIMEAWKMQGASIPDHCARIKASPLGKIVDWAWPHDMNAAAAGAQDGSTIAELYKEQGILMRSTWAVHERGGYSPTTGNTLMNEAFKSGTLKIAAGLHEFRKEYESYHIRDGKIHKVFDDIISAARCAFTDLRYAKPLDVAGTTLRRRRRSYNEGPDGKPMIARGAEEDPWGG